MIKYIRHWLLRIWPWYRHRALYVIADATDNSITLSKALFEHMDVMKLDEVKVFVYRLGTDGLYAFSVNPPLNKPSQLSDIQYNSKHKTIGFESLCPTVNRIFYDYGLPTDVVAKLSVEVNKTTTGLTYYTILSPHEKYTY